MTRSHLDAILTFFPEAANKAWLACEFTPELQDFPEVPDPIGLGLHAYLQTRDILSKAVPSILQFIDSTEMSNATTPAQSTTNPSTTVRIALGADHGGVEVKAALRGFLREHGYTVHDLGTESTDSVDYPDYAALVSQQVLSGEADFGVLICKTGIGMSISANRHKGIRAAVVTNANDARTTRQHNNANVLCLGSVNVAPNAAPAIVEAFLSAEFEGGRHARRVEKMDQGADAGGDTLAEVDSAVFTAIEHEHKRQFENIELIASRRISPARAVMEAQGSCLTNKYAEGYPGRRWYGGCENVDVVEQLAIDRVKQLFPGSEHANVQPHSGSQANTAVYFSVLQPGDKILTMNLAHGGHLTHGHKANFSGRFYAVTHYGVSEKDERIDYDALAKVALEVKPKMITAGASAYPRIIDFAAHARDRRQRGRIPLRGHGAHRRTRRGRPASEPRAPSPTSPPRPRTRACAARAAASSSARKNTRRASTARSSPASRAARSNTSSPRRPSASTRRSSRRSRNTPRRSSPTPRPSPRASRTTATASSAAARTITSCSWTCARRASTARSPATSSTRPASP